jgi:hypothetical protein
MATGGDIREITFKHPTIGSGIFLPKAAEDSTINYGGFRSSDDANMVTASGEMIDQINNTRWSFESLIKWDNKSDADYEKLIQLAGDPVLAEWTFTHVSGATWAGTGKPVGEIPGNGNQSTIPLKVAGGGSLKRI